MCKKKKQFEEKTDIIIMQAYRVYSYWAKATNIISGRKAPKLETFLKSPSKSLFVDLIMFTREHGIMSAYDYIDWIIEKRIVQKKWLDETNVAVFKEFLNIHEDPADHALHTVNDINKWLMDNPTKSASDYFDNLSPGIILTLLRKKRIRPWVLFTYGPVIDKWLGDDSYSADSYHRIDGMINCEYWADKADNDPAASEIVNEIMSQVWEYQT